jgi:Glycosyltransferase family 87
LSGPALLAARRRPDTVLVTVTLGLTVLGVLGSYLLKRQCTGPTFDSYGISQGFGRLKYRNLCYSDIQQLWVGRGVREHLFPYLNGRFVPGPHGGQLVGGAVEYPVITGVFMWLAGLPAHTDADYLLASALLLLPFGLLTSWLLARLAGWRSLVFAAAPAMVLYGVHNWDFLATACVAGAVLAWTRRRPGLAGVLLGLGAATKIYPGFFVLPLLLDRVTARDLRGALRALAGGGGAWLTINLPVLLANPTGWWATYRFQASREPDLTTNSIWYWGLPQLTTGQLNVITPVLIGAAWLAALGVGGWLARRRGSYPWVQVAAAMLCAFLLFNKVHSPQYLLWLLPFFVLVRVRWGWWTAYFCADLVLFVGLFRWYYDITRGGDFGVAKQAAIVGVWGKAVLLGLLYVVFLVSPLALRVASTSAARSTSVRSTSMPSPPGGAGDVEEADRGRSQDPAGYSRSGARSSTPPAGSSSPDARTMSRSGLRMSLITSTQ